MIVWRVLRHWLDDVLIDAIRIGSPQPRRWSFGLRAIAVIGVVGFAVAALLAAVAPWLRAHTDLAVGVNQVVMPTWTAPLVLWVLVMALTIGATAIVHLHPLLRILGWLAVLVLMLPFLTVLGDRHTLGLGLLAGGGVLLLGLIVVRWRATFHPLEFGVAGVAVGLGTWVPMLFANSANSYGIDSRPLLIEGVLIGFTQFALPLMLVAGYALAQVTIRAATDLAPALAGRGLVATLIVIGVAELGVIGWQWASGNDTWGWSSLLPALMFVALFVLLAAPLWVRARSVGLPPVHELDEGWSAWLYPIAVGMIALNVPVLLTAVTSPIVLLLAGPKASVRVSDWGQLTQGPSALIIWRSVLALTLVVAAWVLARRGRMAGPLVAVAAAALLTFTAITRATGIPVSLWTPEALTVLGVVAGVVTFIVQAMRRRVDQRVLGGMIGIVAVGLLFPARHVVGEPVDHLLGLSGGALLVFGVAWQLLTGAGFTRQSSKWAPIPARVMLFIANIVLTTVVVAWVSLTRLNSPAIDPAGFAATGDWLLGSPLLLVVLVLLVVQVATGGPPAATETREVEAVEQDVAVQQWEAQQRWDVQPQWDVQQQWEAQRQMTAPQPGQPPQQGPGPSR